ncbi:hypothetical protein [Fredinandcohnia sp. 179-A 10B2 NHS]
MLSKEILKYVGDGDLHIKMIEIEYSTSVREIITLEFMLNNPYEE